MYVLLKKNTLDTKDNNLKLKITKNIRSKISLNFIAHIITTNSRSLVGYHA